MKQHLFLTSARGVIVAAFATLAPLGATQAADATAAQPSSFAVLAPIDRDGERLGLLEGAGGAMTASRAHGAEGPVRSGTGMTEQDDVWSRLAPIDRDSQLVGIVPATY